MKKFILSLALLAFSFQSANAQWWSNNEEIEGNGDYTSETRNLSEYDRVALQGSLDVRLVAGTEGDLKVNAESNLMEYIITEVKNGTLRIKVEDGVDLEPSRDHEVLITVPFESLSAVSLTGSGDIISSDRIKAETFKMEVTGSGDIELEVSARELKGQVTGSGDIVLIGKAEEFDCEVTGSGDIDASGLKASRVTARVSGSGDISVHATESLKSRVAGSGDISYSGNPKKQDFRTSGSGSISGR